MVAQQAVGSYVVLDGIERPVRPEVAKKQESKFDIRRYVQNPTSTEIELDNSRLITRAVYELRRAESDRYTSLAQSQPLVRAGKVSLDSMREVLGNFYNNILRSWIWGELMDSQPQLRGFKLPRGKNALLYRGQWTVKDDYDIDVSTMDPEKDVVAVTVPNGYGIMNQSWKEVTGIDGTFRDAVHYPANLVSAKKDLNGQYALVWDFGDRDRPDLGSGRRPDVRVSDGGALLGSRLSADEIVEGFVQTEPQRPQRSAYESRLDTLGRQLDDLRRGYNVETIRSMGQMLADLEKLDPQ